MNKIPFLGVIYLSMKAIGKGQLRKGQVWRTRAADFEILALGQSCIHYKVRKQFGRQRKHVSAQVSGIDAMENYLWSNRAQLVTCNN